MKNLDIPEQLLGTCVVVLSKDRKKVMMGKRKNSFMSGYYGLPGGRLELKEKLMDCAKRELLEETGLEVESLEYLGVIRDLRENYTFMHFAFLCKNYKGEPKVTEPDKCEGWEWFDLDQVPEKSLPSHLAAVDIFMKPELANLRDIHV